MWKFRFTVIENHHWNTTRTRHLSQSKVGYDIFNQHGSYRNIMQFQISSKRKNRKRDTRVIIRISILRKSFYQTILLHQIQRETPQGCWIEDQTNLCWEHYYEFAKSPENQVSGKGKTIVLLVYTSLAASRTFACLNFSFRLRRFTLLVQTKKMISVSYGSTANSWQIFSHNQAFFKKLKITNVDFVHNVKQFFLHYTTSA